MFFPWRLHAQTEQLLVFIKILVHLLLIFEKSLSKLVTDELSSYINKIINVTLLQSGITEAVVDALVRGCLILLVLCLSWFGYKIAQGPLNRVLERLSGLTNQQWDDVLVEKHVF